MGAVTERPKVGAESDAEARLAGDRAGRHGSPAGRPGDVGGGLEGDEARRPFSLSSGRPETAKE